VIFISIGYGRDAVGYLTMNFGPLNKEGGERRLNVLITRARQRCEVFTNLEASDINLHKTNAQGVKALKRFLKYAADRQMDMPDPTERETDSPFETSVAEAIRALGYEVVHQVGSAGFFIDLAVIDPAKSGRYLLGIECDGATYHSSRSARDRDRLRQQVLEGLGWRIHRIWSTDWFQNPTRQIEKLVEVLENAKRDVRIAIETPPDLPELVTVQATTAPAIARLEPTSDSPPKGDVHYYQQADLSMSHRYELHETPRSQLAQYITQVVAVESPVHKEGVMRRILAAADVTRLGPRIQQSLESAIQCF